VDDQDDWDRNKMVRMKRLNPMTSSYEWKNRTPAFAASKMTKMLLDGQLKPGRHEDGGTTWEGIDEFLDKYVDIAYIKQYLNENLKLRFATPPKISDPKRMLWRLWSRPAPPLGPEIVTLGQVSIPYVTLT